MKKALGFLESSIFVFLACLMLLPFGYMLICSLQVTYSEYVISFDVTKFTFDNWIKVFSVSGFTRWLQNSFFISITGVLLTLTVCSLSSYAFARLRFKGSKISWGAMMASMVIPFPATVVPLWLMVGKMHGIDKFWPLILPIPAMLGVILIRQAIVELPKELFECAKIDGHGDFSIFVRVVIPAISPILITVAVLFFARSWNSFLWPLIISNSDATKTLPVALAAMQGRASSVNYGITMAGSMITFLPPFILYVFLQKYFIKGIAGSGLKV